MKHTFLTLLALLAIAGGARGQGSVTAAEYFVDADPGVGQGIALAIGAAGAQLSFTASIPTAALAPGFHTVAVRVRNDSARWSLPEPRALMVLGATPASTSITAAEYFVDADPGPGAGTALAVGAAAASVSFSAIVPTASLAPGFHLVGLRARNATGAWSLHEPRGVFVMAQPVAGGALTAAEFFVDTDPGPGAATPVVVGAPGGTVAFAATVPTTALQPGFHLAALRTRNAAGRWSIAEARGFFVIAPPVSTGGSVVAAEYFLDTDPGTGAGTPVAVGTPGAGVAFGAVMSTAGLAPGFHLIAVRVKDAAGRWSLHENRGFFVFAAPANTGSIAAAEYFVDADPGVGTATALAVPTPGSPATFVAQVSTTGLADGPHLVSIRVKNSAGKWSLYEQRGFWIRAGETGADVPIVAGEWFLDADPGIGAATAYGFSSPSDSVAGLYTAQIPFGTPQGQHLLASRVLDSIGRWSALEYDTVTVGYPIDFVFTGTGSWKVAGNWQYGFKPRPVIPARGSITIFGAGPADLDTVQTLDSGARLVIRQSKNMNVLPAGGRLNLRASVADSGALAWAAPGVLTVDVAAGMRIAGPGSISISAPNLTVKDTLATAGGVTLQADTLALDGRIETAGLIALKPATDAASIGIGAGVGTFHLSTAEIARLQDGASSVTIGRAGTGSSAVDIRNATFTDALSVHGGRVKVTGLNTGANPVSITALTGNILDSSDAATDITASAVTLSAPAGALAPGASPGVFSIAGSYAHSGVLQVEVGGTTPGTGHDQLAVSGGLTLGGTLNVSMLGSFTPAMTDTFVLVTAASIQGSFAATNLPTNWVVVYTPTAVKLAISAVALPVKLVSFAGIQNARGGADLRWEVSSEAGMERYTVERSLDARTFVPIGEQMPTGRAAYLLTDDAPPAGEVYYRLRVEEGSGVWSYSGVVRIIFDEAGRYFAVHPNPTSDGWISVHSSVLPRRITAVDAAGKEVLSLARSANGRYDLRALPAGAYLLRTELMDGGVEVRRVVRR